MKYILLVLLLSGCGANHYMRRAERNLARAIEHGAKVEADTIRKTVTFVAPSMSFSTTLEAPNWQDTVVLRGKDSIQVKIFRVPATPTEPEKVYVKADCPPQLVQKEIPIAVNRKISSGYGLWDVIIAAATFFVLGYLARIGYMMIRVSFKNSKKII